MPGIQTDSSPVLPRLLYIDQVLKIVPLSRATIYDHIGKGLFPKPIQFAGCRSKSAWLESDIKTWFDGRVSERDGGNNGQ